MTAGVGEQVDDVARRLPADGAHLTAVLLDGRAVAAVTRARLLAAAGR